MPLPDSFIEEIKYRNPIEEIVGEYVPLKRAGANYNGLCPFHSEKTPSFTVFPASRSFYCFGCGAGGDVITFTMRTRNLEYMEALEQLAKRAGIAMPDAGYYRTPAVSREKFLRMNRDAAKFFYSCLGKAPEAREYLERRQLPTALCRHFGLGYAPDSFDALTGHMRELGYRDNELVEGFLAGRSRKTGRLFDMFRGRIIIPIIDNSGEIIAFGGRIIGDGTPKYLNSSDTPVFKKSRNLFALNFARSACAESMILCEGYMDVIALHGAGITNAVATLGTAITPEQARMMTRYTKQVYISYDSDEAGQRAAEKAFRLLGEVGLEAKIIAMSGAKDPDEYVKKFGAERFRRLLGESRSEFDFKLDNVMKKYSADDDSERIKAAEELTGIIAGFRSSVERDVYIRRTADRLSLPPEVLKADVERRIKDNRRTERREETREMILKTQGVGDRVNPDYMKNIRAARAEEAALGMMLHYPEYVDLVAREPELLSEDDFVTEFGRRIFHEIYKRYEGDGFDYGRLAECMTADEMGRIQRMILRRAELGDNSERLLRECIGVIKSERRKQKSAESGSALEGIADIIAAKRK